jgi:protein-tyrosine phosphatase
VRLVVDLRTDREIDLDGLGPVAGPPVAHMQLVLLEAASDPTRAATLADRYLEMFERAGGPLGRLLETLAATSEPVLLHCFAGKDRTGVAAAVILGALGVSEEDIVVDYARTQAALPAIRASLEASRAFSAVVDQFPPETLHAAPETMERVLAKVRSRHGDLVGYARSIGVSDETLAALAARLLED